MNLEGPLPRLQESVRHLSLPEPDESMLPNPLPDDAS